MNDNAKQLILYRLGIRPTQTISIGLMSASREEIQDLKDWCEVRNIRYVHKTKHRETGLDLPYNGVFIINPLKSKVKA